VERIMYIAYWWESHKERDHWKDQRELHCLYREEKEREQKRIVEKRKEKKREKKEEEGREQNRKE
jgi:hypothetical protein